MGMKVDFLEKVTLRFSGRLWGCNIHHFSFPLKAIENEGTPEAGGVGGQEEALGEPGPSQCRVNSAFFSQVTRKDTKHQSCDVQDCSVQLHYQCPWGLPQIS